MIIMTKGKEKVNLVQNGFNRTLSSRKSACHASPHRQMPTSKPIQGESKSVAHILFHYENSLSPFCSALNSLAECYFEKGNYLFFSQAIDLFYYQSFWRNFWITEWIVQQKRINKINNLHSFLKNNGVDTVTKEIVYL